MSFFPAFLLRVLSECGALSEYRPLLTDSENRLGFLLALVAICSVAVFFELCTERSLEDDVRDLVGIPFLMRFHSTLNMLPSYLQLSNSNQLHGRRICLHFRNPSLLLAGITLPSKDFRSRKFITLPLPSS